MSVVSSNAGGFDNSATSWLPRICLMIISTALSMMPLLFGTGTLPGRRKIIRLPNVTVIMWRCSIYIHLIKRPRDLHPNHKHSRISCKINNRLTQFFFFFFFLFGIFESSFLSCIVPVTVQRHHISGSPRSQMTCYKWRKCSEFSACWKAACRMKAPIETFVRAAAEAAPKLTGILYAGGKIQQKQ